MKNGVYKIYKLYRADIWSDVSRSLSLSSFWVLKAILFGRGRYKRRKEDFRRLFLFRRRRYIGQGLVFLNKQKLRLFYINIKISQMKRLYLQAGKCKGLLADAFLGLLESRLDVALYRLNFVYNMFETKSFLINLNVFVNHKCVTKPGHILKPGDLITLNNKKFRARFLNLLHSKLFIANCPGYFEVNYKLGIAIFVRRPKIRDVFFPFSINCFLASQYFKDIT